MPIHRHHQARCRRNTLESHYEDLATLDRDHIPHIDSYTLDVEKTLASYIAIVIRIRVRVRTVDLAANSSCFRSFLNETFWMLRCGFALLWIVSLAQSDSRHIADLTLTRAKLDRGTTLRRLVAVAATEGVFDCRYALPDGSYPVNEVAAFDFSCVCFFG